jgi:hypothetical protein
MCWQIRFTWKDYRTDGKTKVSGWGIDLTKMKDTGSAECLTYECRFPIFDETLWRAFGDGASQKRARLT